MNAQDPRFAPPDDWADPRLSHGFQPEHFPRCDGGEPPPVAAADLKERRKLEFLAAYYAINGAYMRLRAAADADRHAAMLNLNAAQLARDHLEDRYAPIGFYGEPRFDGDRTVDLVFMHAPVEPPTTPLISSAVFALEPPVAIPEAAPRRVLDTAGFMRLLKQQIGDDPTSDGKADP